MSMYYRWAPSIACIFLLLFTSCSGRGGSNDDFISGESLYDPGSPVDAKSFTESSPVELSLIQADGSATVLHDGDFIAAENKKLSVKVGGDATTIDRVFVADGEAYQVEAMPENGRYVCEFRISEDNLYQNVLVQVIHHDGRASKEKIVLRPYNPHPEDAYTKNGIGILVSGEILDDQKDSLAELLDEKMGAIFSSLAASQSSVIRVLSYGDDDPATRDIVVNSLDGVQPGALHVNFTIRNVSLTALPMYGQYFLSTDRNDLTIDAYVTVRDADEKGDIRLILDFSGTALATFAKPFFFQQVIEDLISSEMKRIDLPPVAVDLEDKAGAMRDLLPGHLTVNETDVDVIALLSGLNTDLEKYLFADVYTISEDPVSGLFALGLGLCVDEDENIAWGAKSSQPHSSQFDMESAFGDLFASAADSMIQTIRQKYQGLITELSYDDCVISSVTLENTGDPDIRIAQVNFTLKRVDLRAVSLFGLSLIATTDNDLSINSAFTLEYRETASGKEIVVGTQSVSSVQFAKIFIGKLSIEEMIRQDLQSMTGKSVSLTEILAGFELGMDMSGPLSPDRYPLFPGLAPYIQTPDWDLRMQTAYNVRCAISQNCINQLLDDLLGQVSEWDVKELLIPILGESFPGFDARSSEGEATVLKLSVPPMLDLRSRIRLVVPDVIIQYRVSGTPQWEASIDLDLIITPRVEGGKLNFYFTPVEGRNHFHVMKDNRGNLGIFDHSALVEKTIRKLPEMLGNSPGGPVASFDLKTLEPDIVLKNIDDPMKISAGGYYLYIDAAASMADLVKLYGLL